MWSLLKASLKQSGRSLAFLSLGAGFFFFVVVWSFGSFTKDLGSIPFLSDPPRAIQAMLGSSDFLSPKGWIAIGLGHPVCLALFSAAALGLAAGSVAGEVERGTIDFILAKPIDRSTFLLAKAISALVGLTLVEGGGLVGTLLARLTTSSGSLIPLVGTVRGFLGSWVMFAAFALIALLISATSSLKSRALGISVGVLVGSFFLNVLALLVDGLYGLRFFSLFHYVKADDLLSGTGMSLLLVPLATALVAAALAFSVFARRDIVR